MREKKRTGYRSKRVGEEIRHALSGVLLQGGLWDDQLRHPITVTQVHMTPDLRRAVIQVVPMTGDKKDVLKSLQRHTPNLRHEVASKVQLKYMPDFTFELDSSFDQALRIHKLLETTRSDQSQEDNVGQ